MQRRVFQIELIKPSHYDDDGYLIQWRRAWVPSNTLSCLDGITQDIIDRSALGAEVASCAARCAPSGVRDCRSNAP